jgi:hypothetical protein
MRRTLVVTFALMAATAFGQGLGITPDLPVGTSALTVTPQAGPWMILAASYGGPPSRGQAEELATEIRTRYSLPAYIFNRTAEERRAEQDRVARLKEEARKKLEADGLPATTPVYIKTVRRIEDQYAVLVGGYKDDVAARKALEDIRKLKPKSDGLNKIAYVPDAHGKMHEEAINPFQSAFVCHNPTVPVEKPKQDIDMGQRLKEYNVGETYSLLKCPKPFTMVVRVYKGESMVQSQTGSRSVMDKMGMKFGSVLNANGNEAHKMAEFLRNKQPGLGFEAYALHTEYNSYVTIGGFDSPDDPRLLQTMQYFLKEMNRPGSGVNQLHMRAQLLTDPMLMPVPQVK